MELLFHKTYRIHNALETDAKSLGQIPWIEPIYRGYLC